MSHFTKACACACSDKTRFQQSLINWFEENGREYPWRHCTNPYEVLLSEVLLQQTNADKVVDVYNQLLREFPDLRALALSDINELTSLMKPVGLRYRAARLKKLCEIIVEKYGGDIPSEEGELLNLPGIGQYITNAILCFAFSCRVPLVDVNVLRMYERVFSLKSAKRRAREDPLVWQFAADMLPDDFKQYNWAIIDFCAKVCSTGHPSCDTCPVGWTCGWLESRRSLHDR